MAVSCPNCKIPCTGCAGAKLTKASDGATVCTKCIGTYEFKLKGGISPSIGGSPLNVTILRKSS